MWKWYTAVMTHYSLCSFPVDRITRVITSRVIRDLAPLVGVGTDEAEAWTPKVKIFCHDVALAARSMALTHSKIWVAWKPENYTQWQSGFLVSSATDEGLNVMMKPWAWIPWRPLHDPNSLNGKKVHLVVSPALVGSFLFTAAASTWPVLSPTALPRQRGRGSESLHENGLFLNAKPTANLSVLVFFAVGLFARIASLRSLKSRPVVLELLHLVVCRFFTGPAHTARSLFFFYL